MSSERQVLSATSVIGNQVRNRSGEPVGHVGELIIDPDTGRIIGALLLRRGLAKGEQISAIPWDAVTVDQSDGAIYVDSETVEHPLPREGDWLVAGAVQSPRNVVVYTSICTSTPKQIPAR